MKSVFQDLFDVLGYGIKMYIAITLCFVVLPILAIILFLLALNGELLSTDLGKFFVWCVFVVVCSFLWGAISTGIKWRKARRLQQEQAEIEAERNKVRYVIIK